MSADPLAGVKSLVDPLEGVDSGLPGPTGGAAPVDPLEGLDSGLGPPEPAAPLAPLVTPTGAPPGSPPALPFALDAASRMQPEKAQKALQKAHEAAVEPGVAYREPERLEEVLLGRRIKLQMPELSESRALEAWLAGDPVKAAAVQGDLEKYLRLRTSLISGPKPLAEVIGARWEAGKPQARMSELVYPVMFGTATPEQLAEWQGLAKTGDAARQKAETKQFPPGPYPPWLTDDQGKALDELARSLAGPREPSQAEKFLGSAAEQATGSLWPMAKEAGTGAVIAGGLVAAGGLTALALGHPEVAAAAGRMLLPAMRAGGGAKAIEAAYRLNLSESYARLQALETLGPVGPGVPHDAVVAAALVSAILKTGLDFPGWLAFSKLLPGPLKKALSGPADQMAEAVAKYAADAGVLGTLAKFGAAYGVAVTTEGVTEFAQEFPDAMAAKGLPPLAGPEGVTRRTLVIAAQQAWQGAKEALPQAIEAGTEAARAMAVSGFASGVLRATHFGVSRVAESLADAKRMEAFHVELEGLRDMAEKSPEAFRDLVQRISDEAGKGTVYMEPGTVPVESHGDLAPATRAEILQAATEGRRAAIPTGEYAAFVHPYLTTPEAMAGLGFPAPPVWETEAKAPEAGPVPPAPATSSAPGKTGAPAAEKPAPLEAPPGTENAPEVSPAAEALPTAPEASFSPDTLTPEEQQEREASVPVELSARGQAMNAELDAERIVEADAYALEIRDGLTAAGRPLDEAAAGAAVGRAALISLARERNLTLDEAQRLLPVISFVSQEPGSIGLARPEMLSAPVRDLARERNRALLLESVAAWRNPGAPLPGERLPILTMLKTSGGVLPRSRLAGELRNMGVTPRTMRGLFRLGRDRLGRPPLETADNLVREEWPDLAAFLPAAEGTGYFDERALLDAIREELAGRPIRTERQEEEIAERERANRELEEAFGALGIDPEGKTDAELVETLLAAETARVDTLFHPARDPDAANAAADEQALVEITERIAGVEDELGGEDVRETGQRSFELEAQLGELEAERERIQARITARSEQRTRSRAEQEAQIERYFARGGASESQEREPDHLDQRGRRVSVLETSIEGWNLGAADARAAAQTARAQGDEAAAEAQEQQLATLFGYIQSARTELRNLRAVMGGREDPDQPVVRGSTPEQMAELGRVMEEQRQGLSRVQRELGRHGVEIGSYRAAARHERRQGREEAALRYDSRAEQGEQEIERLLVQRSELRAALEAPDSTTERMLVRDRLDERIAALEQERQMWARLEGEVQATDFQTRHAREQITRVSALIETLRAQRAAVRQPQSRPEARYRGVRVELHDETAGDYNTVALRRRISRTSEEEAGNDTAELDHLVSQYERLIANEAQYEAQNAIDAVIALGPTGNPALLGLANLRGSLLRAVNDANADANAARAFAEANPDEGDAADSAEHAENVARVQLDTLAAVQDMTPADFGVPRAPGDPSDFSRDAGAWVMRNNAGRYWSGRLGDWSIFGNATRYSDAERARLHGEYGEVPQGGRWEEVEAEPAPAVEQHRQEREMGAWVNAQTRSAAAADRERRRLELDDEIENLEGSLEFASEEFTAAELARGMEDEVHEFMQRHEFRLAAVNTQDRERMLEAMVTELGIEGGVRDPGLVTEIEEELAARRAERAALGAEEADPLVAGGQPLMPAERRFLEEQDRLRARLADLATERRSWVATTGDTDPSDWMDAGVEIERIDGEALATREALSALIQAGPFSQAAQPGETIAGRILTNPTASYWLQQHLRAALARVGDQVALEDARELVRALQFDDMMLGDPPEPYTVADPTSWLARAYSSAIDRDSVDALNDAESLVAALEERVATQPEADVFEGDWQGRDLAFDQERREGREYLTEHAALADVRTRLNALALDRRGLVLLLETSEPGDVTTPVSREEATAELGRVDREIARLDAEMARLQGVTPEEIAANTTTGRPLFPGLPAWERSENLSTRIAELTAEAVEARRRGEISRNTADTLDANRWALEAEILERQAQEASAQLQEIEGNRSSRADRLLLSPEELVAEMRLASQRGPIQIGNATYNDQGEIRGPAMRSGWMAYGTAEFLQSLGDGIELEVPAGEASERQRARIYVPGAGWPAFVDAMRASNLGEGTIRGTLSSMVPGISTPNRGFREVPPGELRGVFAREIATGPAAARAFMQDRVREEQERQRTLARYRGVRVLPGGPRSVRPPAQIQEMLRNLGPGGSAPAPELRAALEQELRESTENAAQVAAQEAIDSSHYGVEGGLAELREMLGDAIELAEDRAAEFRGITLAQAARLEGGGTEAGRTPFDLRAIRTSIDEATRNARDEEELEQRLRLQLAAVEAMTPADFEPATVGQLEARALAAVGQERQEPTAAQEASRQAHIAGIADQIQSAEGARVQAEARAIVRARPGELLAQWLNRATPAELARVLTLNDPNGSYDFNPDQFTPTAWVLFLRGAFVEGDARGEFSDWLGFAAPPGQLLYQASRYNTPDRRPIEPASLAAELETRRADWMLESVYEDATEHRRRLANPENHFDASPAEVVAAAVPGAFVRARHIATYARDGLLVLSAPYRLVGAYGHLGPVVDAVGFVESEAERGRDPWMPLYLPLDHITGVGLERPAAWPAETPALLDLYHPDDLPPAVPQRAADTTVVPSAPPAPLTDTQQRALADAAAELERRGQRRNRPRGGDDGSGQGTLFQPERPSEFVRALQAARARVLERQAERARAEGDPVRELAREPSGARPGPLGRGQAWREGERLAYGDDREGYRLALRAAAARRYRRRQLGLPPDPADEAMIERPGPRRGSRRKVFGNSLEEQRAQLRAAAGRRYKRRKAGLPPDPADEAMVGLNGRYPARRLEAWAAQALDRAERHAAEWIVLAVAESGVEGARARLVPVVEDDQGHRLVGAELPASHWTPEASLDMEDPLGRERSPWIEMERRLVLVHQFTREAPRAFWHGYQDTATGEVSLAWRTVREGLVDVVLFHPGRQGGLFPGTAELTTHERQVLELLRTTSGPIATLSSGLSISPEQFSAAAEGLASEGLVTLTASAMTPDPLARQMQLTPAGRQRLGLDRPEGGGQGTLFQPEQLPLVNRLLVVERELAKAVDRINRADPRNPSRRWFALEERIGELQTEQAELRVELGLPPAPEEWFGQGPRAPGPGQQPSLLPRGSVELDPYMRRATVAFLTAPDRSTLFHELGHIYTLSIIHRAGLPNANPRDVSHAEILKRFVGYQEGQGELTEAQKERLANGFWVYLGTGRAPSKALRPVFAKMRQWFYEMGETVRSLIGLDNLPDDVRMVFDRILATEQEIAELREDELGGSIFAPGMLSAEEQAAISEAMEASAAATRVELDKIQFKELNRRRGIFDKIVAERARKLVEARAAIEIEVRREVERMQVWRADHYLRTGKYLGRPTPPDKRAAKISRPLIVELFGPGSDAAKAILAVPTGSRSWLSVTKGVHPDELAEDLGYDTGAELVQALLAAGSKEAGSRERVIQTETTRRMRATEALPAAEFEEAARVAFRTEARMKLLLLEDETLNARTGNTTVTGLEERAQAIIQAKQHRNLNPKMHRSVARKSRRLALLANNAGKFVEAQVHLRRGFLHELLELESMERLKRDEKIIGRARFWDRNAKARKEVGLAGSGFLDNMDWILEQVELRVIPMIRARRSAIAFSKWLDLREESGDAIVVPDWITERGGVHWREMTGDEIEGLGALLESIANAAKAARFTMLGEERVERSVLRERYAAELIGGVIRPAYTSGHLTEDQRLTLSGVFRGMRDHDAREFGDMVFRMGRSMQSAVVGKEALIWSLVGGDVTSALYQGIIAKIQIAFSEHTDRMRRFVEPVQKLHARYLTRRGRERYTELLPENRLANRFPLLESGPPPPFKLTRRELLGIAYNLGNDSNLAKLVGGFGWFDTRHLDGARAFLLDILDDHLDAEDWQHVQGVWDLLESLKPEVFAHEERMTGVPPQAIEPQAFTTPRTGVVMRGGYFPVVYDPRRSDEASMHEAQKGLEASPLGIGRVETSHPFTKGRTGLETRALKIDGTAILMDHLEGVSRDLAFRGPLLDIYKTLNDAGLQNVIRQTLGNEFSVQSFWKPWLQTMAKMRENPQGLRDWERIALTGRRKAAAFVMLWRATTILIQLTGFPNSIQALVTLVPGRVGTGKRHFVASRALARGYWDSFGNGHYTEMVRIREAALAESHILRTRLEAYDRELMELEAQIRGRTGLKPMLIRAGSHAIAWVQLHAIDMPLYLAAKRLELDKGRSEADAKAAADTMVTTAQGSGLALSQAEIFTVFDALRSTLTFLGTYPNTALNQVMGEWRTHHNLVSATAAVVMAGMMPALAAYPIRQLVYAAMRAAGLAAPEPPDDEDIPEELLKEALGGVARMVPGGGDMARNVMTGQKNAPGWLGVWQKEILNAVKAGEDLFTGGDWDESFLQAMKTLGLFAGYPAEFPLSTTERTLEEGDEDVPKRGTTSRRRGTSKRKGD